MIDCGECVVHKIQVYLKLLRPFTLLAPIIVSSSVMIASLVYSGTTEISLNSLLLTVISASICFALLNGASNVLNQATDWKEDLLSKPYRPIPRGMLSAKEATKLSFLLYTFALFLSLTVHIIFCLFVCIIVLFSITYSIRPRVKKFLFLNQVWVALPRGFFGIIGSWSVFGNPFESLPLTIACVATLFLFGGTTTKDILDAEADKMVGTKTFVNVYGLKIASIISLIFMISAFCLLVPCIYFNIIPAEIFPLAFLSIFSIIIGWSMMKTQKNTKCENTSSWTLMYTTYFIFAFSFAVIIIFSFA
jgi:geranylgeranylglycerol-phosphate geranylgeranyltransferase